MGKKTHMKQAGHEVSNSLFTAAQAVSSPPAEPGSGETTPLVSAAEDRTSPPSAKPECEKGSAVSRTSRPASAASYLAPGTVVEGTLRSVGDVEIAGEFTGNITTQGTVILHSNIQGNLTVSSLNLSGCTLVGDVSASDAVTISEDSEVCGNIAAGDLQCAGSITGDLNVAGSTALTKTARINGNIITGFVSVMKGAVMKGRVETHSAETDTQRNKK